MNWNQPIAAVIWPHGLILCFIRIIFYRLPKSNIPTLQVLSPLQTMFTWLFYIKGEKSISWFMKSFQRRPYRILTGYCWQFFFFSRSICFCEFLFIEVQFIAIWCQLIEIWEALFPNSFGPSLCYCSVP